MNRAFPSLHGGSPEVMHTCPLSLMSNRLSGTIEGNIEFVHSQYSCILTSQVLTQFSCINNSDKFRVNAYLTVK